MIYDTIIVGGGPAGITAGIYLARANKKVAIVERFAFGGQVAEIGIIENYPGIQKISGSDLAMNMYKQAKDFGVDFILDEVQSYKLDSDEKIIFTNKKEYHAKSIVLALGSKPKDLNIKKEKSYIGKGLSYCATCDGNFFKNKKVAVAGSGDSALSNACYLAEIASEVYVISKYEPLKLKNATFDEIAKAQNITFIEKAQIKDIMGENKIEAISYEQNGEEKTLFIDGLFVSIGRNPDTESLKGLIDLDDQGYILTNDKLETNVKGVYACGDVVSGMLKQIVSAASSGAVASVSVLRYLSQIR